MYHINRILNIVWMQLVPKEKNLLGFGSAGRSVGRSYVLRLIYNGPETGYDRINELYLIREIASITTARRRPDQDADRTWIPFFGSVDSRNTTNRTNKTLARIVLICHSSWTFQEATQIKQKRLNFQIGNVKKMDRIKMLEIFSFFFWSNKRSEKTKCIIIWLFPFSFFFW